MRVADAYAVLGLPTFATEEDVEARYRVLARERHPDVGGSSDEMQDLNLARDVARDAISRARAVVPVDVVREIVVATTTALARREESRREVRTVVARIRGTLTNQLRSYRQMATLLGGASAAGMFVAKDLPDGLVGKVASPEMGGMITLTALGVGVYCALGYWFLTTRIERAERLFEDLSNYLSIRASCFSFLDEITKGAERWTLKELEHCVTVWSEAPDPEHRHWVRLVRDAGAADVSRLLVSKGRELNLLSTTESFIGRRLVESYSLSVGITANDV